MLKLSGVVDRVDCYLSNLDRQVFLMYGSQLTKFLPKKDFSSENVTILELWLLVCSDFAIFCWFSKTYFFCIFEASGIRYKHKIRVLSKTGSRMTTLLQSRETQLIMVNGKLRFIYGGTSIATLDVQEHKKVSNIVEIPNVTITSLPSTIMTKPTSGEQQRQHHCAKPQTNTKPLRTQG